MDAQEIKLPDFDMSAGKSLIHSISYRHSVRAFDTQKEVSDTTLVLLLWCSVGINRENAIYPFPGKPSANHCNPTAMNSQEIRAYVFGTEQVFEYVPESHSLRIITEGDYRHLIAGNETFSQAYVMDAPYSIVFGADTVKLREKAERKLWAAFDAGTACESLNLAFCALGLSTVPRATMDLAGISIIKLLYFNHLFLFLAFRSSDGDFPKCRLTYLPKKERFSKPKRYDISFIE